MQNNTSDKEQWISRVMQSTEGISRAEGNPFLSKKLLARLKPAEGYTVSPRVAWLGVTVVLIMAVLNAALMFKTTRTGGDAAVVATEYNLTVSDPYAAAIHNLAEHE